LFAEIGIVLALLVGVVLLFRGCAGCVADMVVARLPAEVDAAIGKAGAESMRAKYGVGQAPTEQQKQRVERIFAKLRAKLTAKQKAVLQNPRVTVAVDGQVNAFALPGGEVFVLTGLLDRVGDDDALLRGVLAHELGHAVKRHGVRQLARTAVYSIALSLLLGQLDETTAKLVAGAASLDRLHYSRSMETEADEFGVALLRRGGYGCDGLARFLESLDKVPVPELLSTHPDSKERAADIRDKCK